MSPLAAAAASGDRLAFLRELRGRLVESLDAATCVRDTEPLARRLQNIVAEIADLEPAAEESPADQIAARRAKRRGTGA